MLSALIHGACFICTWLLLGSMGFGVWRMLDTGIANIKTLHRIPCSYCKFFTGDPRLKCTVHPGLALTEEAIGCSDYESASIYGTSQVRS